MSMQLHHIKSFVTRTSKLTNNQSKSMEQLLPKFAYGVKKVFPSNVNILDIGFGNGEDLSYQAQNHPNINFLGAEVYKPGIANFLQKVADCDNVQVFAGNVFELLDDLPSQSMDKVMLLYPDPWPKKRQQKRRIIRPEFIRQLGSILKPKGIFYVCTDSLSYAKYIMEVMDLHAKFVATTKEDKYNIKLEHQKTKFATKADAKGHNHWHFYYRLETHL